MEWREGPIELSILSLFPSEETMTRESKFQADLIEELRLLFPEAFILKNDAGYIQGCPDILILCGPKWAALEVKASKNSKKQYNQEYYITKLGEMSYAAFVYPENIEEILNELRKAL